jgi:hypothetical protein
MRTVSVDRVTESGVVTLTVELRRVGGGWLVCNVLDEWGRSATLTRCEQVHAERMASSGVDETGR